MKISESIKGTFLKRVKEKPEHVKALFQLAHPIDFLIFYM